MWGRGSRGFHLLRANGPMGRVKKVALLDEKGSTRYDICRTIELLDSG